MNPNINNTFHYDAYYEWKENNGGSYEHDDGEYVLEQKIKDKEPNSNKNKSRHKKSEAGVYDEIDYDLSPRNETHSQNQNQILVDDLEKKDGCSKHKKMAIISILVITLVVSVVTGAALVTYGKYDLPFQLPNSSMDFKLVNPVSVIYSLLLLGLQNDTTSDENFRLKTTTTPSG